MSARRVFIRGVGVVSALGRDWPSTANALAEGRSAIRPITHFDVEDFPCTVGAPVLDPELEGPDRRLGLARRAAREAWAGAGVSVAPERLGVFIGAESGRATLATVRELAQAAGGGRVFDHRSFGARAPVLAERIDASVVSPAAVASVLAGEWDARGPAQTVSLACASGSAAIIEATRALRLGLCDVALCGGVGADVDPLMLAGFGHLGILSAKGCSRPFDLRRDGFVVGEGAAMVVLSVERGGAVAEIAGVGRSLDAYNLTAPDPEGDGARRSMEAALREARVEAVDYVQAHGTSTPLNDPIEARALRVVLKDGLARARVGGVKGALGHWVAGAGALGLVCAYEAVVGGRMLPTAGLETPDPDCDLPHLIGEAVHQEVGTALVNAFAFGGANTSLVVRRCA